ncbi:MAG: hypothetical protein RR034_05210, partial [Bacteroidales bacterium]
NGEDEWEVNKPGYIRFVEGSKGNPDKLFAVGGKGKGNFDGRTENAKSVDVDKDVMNSLKSGITVYSDQSVEYYSMDVSGKEHIAKDMFKFMSKNTAVEWSYFGERRVMVKVLQIFQQVIET